MENIKTYQAKLDEYLSSFGSQNQSNFQCLEGYGLALLTCTKQFNGRFSRSLITAKKRIAETIHQNIEQLKDVQISLIRSYLKHMTVQHIVFLNDGVLNVYLGLVDLVKKHHHKNCQQGSQSQITIFVSLIKEIQKCLRPLLIFYSVNRQYKKRISSINCLIKSYSKISSQKKIPLEQSQKNKNLDKEQQENQEILTQIEQQFSTLTISQLVQKYLKQEENKIIDSTEICRLCERKIKLKEFQYHIKNCSKKTKLQMDLKNLQQKQRELNQQILEFQDKFIFKTEECKQIQLYILKIIKMIKQAHMSRKNTVRRNTQSPNMKNQPIENIKRQLQIFQEKYQKNPLLRNIVKNKDDIINIKRKLANLQMNSMSKVSSSRGSDIGSFKSLQSSINNVLITPNNLKTKKSLFASKNQNKSKLNPHHQKKSILFRSHSNSNSSSNSNSISGQSNTNSSSSNISNISRDKEKKSYKKIMSSSLPSQKFKQLKSFKDQTKTKEDHQKSSKTMKSILHPQLAQKQQMSLNQFQILKFLGKGAFGKVYLVRRKSTLDLYALKHLIIDNKNNKNQIQLIKNEHQIFKKIAGDHLIRAPFAFSQDFGHFFVLQFMSGGDLSQILSQEVYLQENHARFYLAEIILALQHLHTCNIIHRDLKPQNVVIDKNGHIKLTDFGLSEIKIQDKIDKAKQKASFNRKIQNPKTNRRVALVNKTDAAKVIGTPDYIAPQIINQTSINNSSIDWWSLGVMAYEMLVGCRPFSALTVDQVLENIIQCKIQWPQVGREQGMMSPEAYDLISKLLSKNFQKRLGSQSIQEIKNHPFFEGIDWQHIKKQIPPVIPKNQGGLMKQCSKLQQDKALRTEIMQRHRSSIDKTKSIGLQNFVRYDFLLQQTYQSVEQRICRQKTKIERIKNIGEFIENQQFKQNKDISEKEQNSQKSGQAKQTEGNIISRKISNRLSKNVSFKVQD